MSNVENNEQFEKNEGERKKISLQEAIKQQLEAKKKAQKGNQSFNNATGGNHTMKSQHNKKPNNQRRRMGV